MQSEGSTFTPRNRGGYIFTLTNVDPSIAWFADRPVRRGGTLATDLLLDIWQLGGKASFKADPPNAAITVHDANGAMAAVAVTLKHPKLDSTARTVSFTVKLLNKKARIPTAALNTALGATSVLIDSSPGEPPKCTSGSPTLVDGAWECTGLPEQDFIN